MIINLQVVEFGGPVYCLAWDEKQRQLVAGGRGAIQFLKVLRSSSNYIQTDSEKKANAYVCALYMHIHTHIHVMSTFYTIWTCITLVIALFLCALSYFPELSWMSQFTIWAHCQSWLVHASWQHHGNHVGRLNSNGSPSRLHTSAGFTAPCESIRSIKKYIDILLTNLMSWRHA